jgi:hypothetical protein
MLQNTVLLFHLQHGFLMGICELLAHLRTSWARGHLHDDESLAAAAAAAAEAAGDGPEAELPAAEAFLQDADMDAMYDDGEQQLLMLLQELPSMVGERDSWPCC